MHVPAASSSSRRRSPRGALALAAAALVLALACRGGGGGDPAPAPGQGPAIAGFTAVPEVITLGDAAALTGTFQGGAGTVEPGVGAVQSGQAVTVNPTETTEYLLRVRGADGTERLAKTKVTVAVVPDDPHISGSTLIKTGPDGGEAMVLPQPDCTFHWTLTGVGAITGGQGSNRVTFSTSGPGQITLTCTALNAAGRASKPANLNVRVADAVPIALISTPVQVAVDATGLVASVPTQPGCLYAWSISNGTLTSAGDGPQITYTPSGLGILTLSCSVSHGPDTAVGTCQVRVLPSLGSVVVTAPGTVTARTPGYSAAVTAVTGASYQWSIDGHGLITAGAGTPGILFTPGDPGTQVLTCQVTDAAGSVGQGSATLRVVAEPSSPFITTNADVAAGATGCTASVPAQPGCSYQWTLENATPTGGADTPNLTFTAGVAGTATLTCVVSNAAGTSAAPAKASILVLGGNLPVISALGHATAGKAGYQATVNAPAGSTVAWTLSNGTPGSSLSANPLTFTAGVPGNLTLDCQVTLADGSSLQAVTAVVAVVAAPAIGAFGPNLGIITLGDDLDLTWSFTGGKGLIRPGDLEVAPTGLLTLRPGVDTVYTLRVMNEAGDYVEDTAPVQVAPLPVIRSFRARRPIIGQGESAVLVADFEAGPGGSAQVGSGVGAIASGVEALSPALASGQTFTLTVTNAAGFPVTKEAEVKVGVLELLAGSPTGFGHADGTGTRARFREPVAIALDPAGNAYVADVTDRVIRKITPGGVVSTFAGTPGQRGYQDGGAGARFQSPEGLAWDVTGNRLLVADTGNHAIRSVSPDGLVGTVAGQHDVAGNVDGDQTIATFEAPLGLAVDSHGVIFVGDQGSGRIRSITPAPGGGVQVATVSGLASGFGQPLIDGNLAGATFKLPTGLAVDDHGILYIADSGYDAVRVLNPVTGVVATLQDDPLLRNPLDAVAEPYGLACSPDGSALWVADRVGQAIREYDLRGGDVRLSTVAGSDRFSGSDDGLGRAALFDGPKAIAVRGDGTLLVADAGNAKVRAIDPAGQVSTWAGALEPGSADYLLGPGPASRFSDPAGLAYHPDYGILLADHGNGALRVVDPSTGNNGGSARNPAAPTDGPVATATLGQAAGIAVSGSGRNAPVWFTVPNSQVVRRIQQFGGAARVETVAGMVGVPGSSDVPARFDTPMGVACDAAGAAYVADPGNHTIRKILPDGTVSTLAGQAGVDGDGDEEDGTRATFREPYGLVVDGDSLLVMDRGNASLRRVALAAPHQVTTVAGGRGRGSVDGVGDAARFSDPCTGTLDADGNLFVIDGALLRLVTRSREVFTVVGTPGQFGNLLGPLPGGLAEPKGVLMTDDGNLVISVKDALLRLRFL